MVRARVAEVMAAVNVTTKTVFVETPADVSVERLGVGRYDGAYSVEMRGFPSVNLAVNGQTGIDVSTRINVGFVINQHEKPDDLTDARTNDKSDYTRAVNDVMRVVLAMMQSTAFDDVAFAGAGPLEFIDGDTFATCDIDFILSTTVTP